MNFSDYFSWRKNGPNESWDFWLVVSLFQSILVGLGKSRCRLFLSANIDSCQFALRKVFGVVWTLMLRKHVVSSGRVFLGKSKRSACFSCWSSSNRNSCCESKLPTAHLPLSKNLWLCSDSSARISASTAPACLLRGMSGAGLPPIDTGHPTVQLTTSPHKTSSLAIALA